MSANKMAAIVVIKAEHIKFTVAWRRANWLFKRNTPLKLIQFYNLI